VQRRWTDGISIDEGDLLSQGLLDLPGVPVVIAAQVKFGLRVSGSHLAGLVTLEIGECQMPATKFLGLAEHGLSLLDREQFCLRSASRSAARVEGEKRQ
jgi:hypothetical protein